MTTIIAPAGFGKTTLMGQLHDRGTGPSAWLTLDRSDDDPVILLQRIVGALSRSGVVGETVVAENTRQNPLTAGITELTRGLQDADPATLFLDQVDHLESRDALDVIGELTTRVTSSLKIVLAARTGEGLPIPLLRSRGQLTEIGPFDLAMDQHETAELLADIGLSSDGLVDQIVARTEGWPAGIYLTAVAIRSGADITEAIGGDDIFLADYLRDELLARVPDETLDFLTSTSIFTSMTGSLCDYVLQRNGSAGLLADLEKANLLIVPLDRTRTWYRYHSLLREYMTSLLDRKDPVETQALHGRAADWFENNGMLDVAIEHAGMSGDTSRFVGLVVKSARQVYAMGHVATLRKWFERLDREGELERQPNLAAMGGFLMALEGDPTAAERIGGHALTDPSGRPLDREDLGPFALILRSFQAPRGPEEALGDARLAAERLMASPSADWVPAAVGAQALSTLALGDLTAAEELWADAQSRGEVISAGPLGSFSRAERALLAIERSNWDEAADHVAGALEIIEDQGLESYISSVLAYAVAGRVAARDGDIERAMQRLAQAGALRPLLSAGMPLWSIQSLHEMARAYIEIADIAGARRVVRDAADILARRPRLGIFVADHEHLQDRLAAMPAGDVGASSLTRAEIRLLPMLVTHLSYPEIGERLFLSRHTIKTQAMSIYRKLGVSSRAEAVAKARDVGLINV